jgi:hypothetical protein
MEIAVLGACRATEPARNGGAARVVDLGTRKPRSVLAALTLHLGYDVSPDLLVDLVWSGEAPAGCTPTSPVSAALSSQTSVHAAGRPFSSRPITATS